jgi:hypothetical protein
MIGPSKLVLGRLERVELRNAWAGEATDFTPWLAQPENITLLGEAIGIELEVEAQEQHVGPFRADILCRLIAGPNAKAHFGLIKQRYYATVEERLSLLGQLEWQRGAPSKPSSISLSRSSTPSKRETWSELNEWMAQALETMHALFSPIVRGLNAADFIPSDDNGSDVDDASMPPGSDSNA